MTAKDIIREVQEDASEWLEMVECPATLIAGILANKIIKNVNYIDSLEKRIEYLEKRLDNVNTSTLRSY